MKNLKIFLILVFAQILLTNCKNDDDDGESSSVEICNNGIDDDGDGFVDNDDLD